ncbi:MAG: hypothetical protein FJX34_04915 [Alphaproteobacteria bacterium]|nr:hypothetical protein [Alphaproteobacteria bacterium]
MLNLLGHKEAIAKMSPDEIRQLSDVGIKGSKTNRNDLSGKCEYDHAKIFRDTSAKVPSVMNVLLANSIFKMAQTVTSLKMGLPSIYSCDAMHYPTIARIQMSFHQCLTPKSPSCRGDSVL